MFETPEDVDVAVLPDDELRWRFLDAEGKADPLAIRKMAIDSYNEKTGRSCHVDVGRVLRELGITK